MLGFNRKQTFFSTISLDNLSIYTDAEMRDFIFSIYVMGSMEKDGIDVT